MFSSTAVWYADHPRSRGEYKLVITPHGRREGSSPLSRGILLTKNLRVTKIRIIPALAGNTHFWMSPSPWGWDHPRSRGEYLRDWDQGAPVIGSSPLSRGILQEPGSHLRNIRIIPALAGNTTGTREPPSQHPDHPRSRGEYPPRNPGFSVYPGSSPLSRGIRGRCEIDDGCHGIIPALAGNTSGRSSNPGTSPDHPRSRGEYPGSIAYPAGSYGSSPLSRGILIPAIDGVVEVGIIPALAGNTRARRIRLRQGTDHPRSRGEYQPSVSGQLGGNGSSPLSRGIRNQPRCVADRGGIIPALAGNTGHARGSTNCPRDHPRSRGEYQVEMLWLFNRNGSSPLSRGIRDACPSVHGGEGIIPALAGNTRCACVP